MMTLDHGQDFPDHNDDAGPHAPARRRVGPAPRRDDDLDGWSMVALRARARDLGVEGRSVMTLDELIAALRAG